MKEEDFRKLPAIMTVKQVADFLKIGRSTLYQMWKDGEGPRRIKYEWRSRATRVLKTDLETWLENRGKF